VAAASGPEIWKLPMRKLLLLSWLQQSWKPLVATPAVAVPRSKTSNGVTPTATANDTPAYPVGVAVALAQTSALPTTRTAFELEKPTPVTCTTQDAVNGQSMSCVNGPFSVNVPTSNEKSALAAGACAQHKR
jgi:hypothetical protein